MYVTKSERLQYRRLGEADLEELNIMLTDPRVMYAWEHTFSDEEVRDWLQRQEEAYEQDGMGYFGAVDRSGGELVGQIGLHRFSLEGAAGYEACYMLKYRYFHQGYALEGLRAMTEYAFSKLELPAVYAQVKTNNDASIKVAERGGFVRQSVFMKHYRGKDMPHYLYIKER